MVCKSMHKWRTFLFSGRRRRRRRMKGEVGKGRRCVVSNGHLENIFYVSLAIRAFLLRLLCHPPAHETTRCRVDQDFLGCCSLRWVFWVFWIFDLFLRYVLYVCDASPLLCPKEICRARADVIVVVTVYSERQRYCVDNNNFVKFRNKIAVSRAIKQL